MRLLVTGASGFIGRNLLRTIPPTWPVSATYNGSTGFMTFLERDGLHNVTPVRVNLTEKGAGRCIAALSTEFDACVYLAANGDPTRSVENPRFDLDSNAATLLEVLKSVRIGRFVHLSSGAVYDGLRGAVSPESRVDPTLPYAVSKLASERYVRHFERTGSIGSSVIVRFFGAYGRDEPERKIFTRLVRRFALERDARFVLRGDGRNLIDAMYVDDAVQAILAILRDPEMSSLTLDLSGGRPIPLAELVRTAARAFDLEAEITTFGGVAEHIEFWSSDSTMARRYGFAPRISLEEGLHRLAAHLTADRDV